MRAIDSNALNPGTCKESTCPDVWFMNIVQKMYRSTGTALRIFFWKKFRNSVGSELGICAKRKLKKIGFLICIWKCGLGNLWILDGERWTWNTSRLSCVFLLHCGDPACSLPERTLSTVLMEDLIVFTRSLFIYGINWSSSTAAVALEERTPS